ncbi:PREDICTED: uncharacterized protein LOC109152773 [Ipomoea nil]|uniref:uncharacterized protein LOC109152773 n=1 Tax=Ipomoea nil TaxID=35883 RepID=UPI0009016648|nr:PREDICTED: uncharacterized protein LOC109152773 [Ipomoea nil]
MALVASYPRCWDVELLRDIFNEADVPRILNTPVSIQSSDTWYWKGDLRGLYSVKHGYNSLMREHLSQEPGLEFTNWCAIWSLKIPPKLWEGFGAATGSTFLQMVRHYLTSSNVVVHVQLVASFWTVWLARNESYWNGKRWNMGELKQKQCALVLEWQQAFQVGRGQQPLEAPTTPQGYLKCNIDAAVFDEGAGYAAVLRDHHGGFVVAMNGWFMSLRDPYQAETMAVKEALA